MTRKPVSIVFCRIDQDSSHRVDAVLLVSIYNFITEGVVQPTIISVTLFYNGPNLPLSIFGPFLSIPALESSLEPLSYTDMTTLLPLGSERGTGAHFGASALAGDDGPLFLDAIREWRNFTEVYKEEMAGSIIAFTPVPKSQVLAGRRNGGGNIIDPPARGYAVVQLAQSFAPGVEDVPARLKVGVKELFERCVCLFLNFGG